MTMSDEKPCAEPLLQRWSRRKREAAAAAVSEPVAAAPATVPAEPVVLPSLESLTPESDFAAFMQHGVPSELRQAALKKLFADPHFNVMDGLDIYIDDYTKPDPIAASVVQGLAQFRNLDGLLRDTSSTHAQNADPRGAGACAPAAEAAGDASPSIPGERERVRSEDPQPGPAALDTMSQDRGSSDQFVAPERGRASDFAREERSSAGDRGTRVADK
jgi:hypothetical protein